MDDERAADDAKSGDGSDDYVALATVKALRKKFDKMRREMDQCVMDLEDVREHTELSLNVRQRMHALHREAIELAEGTAGIVSTLEIAPRLLKGEGPRGFETRGGVSCRTNTET
ncbi:MAG TPA: hypothetical protein VHX38_17420 [Pseudonocardiaceae bacterium]|jgi:hypothetical protein|nr:hypothetical protein [Pseudonocardiaceae bacterium]